MQGSIIPNWDLEKFKSLNFTLDKHKDTELVAQYLQAGHDIKNMQMYYCHENDLADLDTNYIRQHFTWINNLALAVNLFTPGQYLPMHNDLYQLYTSVFNLYHTKNIIRIILMLEDSHPGQILQIENEAICNWQAGDWFSWEADKSHAFYNFSMKNRYAIQITGTRC